MKTFIVKIDWKREIEAENEEEAIEATLGEMAIENDSIENYLIAEEIKQA